MLYFKRQPAVARLKQEIFGEGVLIKHFYQCDVIIRMTHNAIFRPKFLEMALVVLKLYLSLIGPLAVVIIKSEIG